MDDKKRSSCLIDVYWPFCGNHTTSVQYAHHRTIIEDHTIKRQTIHTCAQGLAEGRDWGASIACLALLCGFTGLLWRVQQYKAAAEPNQPTTPAAGGRTRARGGQHALTSAVEFDEVRASFVSRAIDIAEHTKVDGDWYMHGLVCSQPPTCGSHQNMNKSARMVSHHYCEY